MAAAAWSKRLLLCRPVPCRPEEESMATSARFPNNPGVLNYLLMGKQIRCFGNKGTVTFLFHFPNIIKGHEAPF